MRRGLSRAEGFALFFAVCNHPVDRDKLIDALGESLPGLRLRTVRLTSKTTDPLDAATRRRTSDAAGPVMFIDMEKAVPSDCDDYPVLRTLNVRREEWPVRLPHPVVFWIPQYVLGILARFAADFLDWRSDTVHFPEVGDLGRELIGSPAWAGGADARMVETDRRERIKELQSRLVEFAPTDDRPVKSARADWLNELGNHYSVLGELHEAEDAFRQALRINEELGRQEGMARQYGNFGTVYYTRGDLDQAEAMLKKALSIFEMLSDLEGITAVYGNLGLIYQTRGDLDQAEVMHKKALAIAEKLGRQEGIGTAYGNLGVIYWTRGDLDQAEGMHKKALAINEKLGSLKGIARDYGNLGLIYQTLGDLDHAEAMHKKALGIHKKLGSLQGIAGDSGNLGAIYQTRGDLDQAEAMLQTSLAIHQKLGHLGGMAANYANLGTMCKQRGDLSKAREHRTKARELYAKAQMPHMAAKVQGWLDELPGPR